ncbi:MAG: conjugal transfer protein TrbI [Lachnospiraceae bacterium]|nr:conjugal transfer protein TrbI [Desulfovibrio sp.]MBR4605811.1 conjugal transfer protein TrbI [Lachnospiraceae bacterium]
MGIFSKIKDLKDAIRDGKASGDPNKLDTIPSGSGTKRVNKLPLIITLILLALFIAVLWYVLEAREVANRMQQKTDEQESGSSAKNSAASIIGKYGNNFIPEKSDPVPPPPELPDTGEVAPKPEPPKIQERQIAVPKPPKNRPPTELENQIWQRRLQSLQQGMIAKTGIGFRNASSAAPASQGMATRNASSPSNSETNDYQQRLAELRQRGGIAGSGGGVAGASATSTADAGSTGQQAGGNNLDSYNRTNRWDLTNRPEKPADPYTIRAGFVIPAIMISGINSDLPGQVMAQVSQNVYDTATGKYRLIPQGTRLIGTYNSGVQYGQKRVFMAWQRLVFPDGRALDIGSMPGADATGYAGFTDDVDNHFFRIFGSAILLSGIVGAISYSQNVYEDSDNDSNKAQSSLSTALGQVLGNTMAQMIQKNMNISPTLTVRPGYRFNVMVVKDLHLTKPYEDFQY